MAGATFIRADLHVHTHADRDPDPQPDLKKYVETAIDRDLRVLAVTDHNHVRFVGAAVEAARETPLLVLPGIEVSTHEGHLLGIFSPEDRSSLEAFAHPENLKLTDVSSTEKRSARSMLDLVAEIADRDGLAIPAHVDAKNGIQEQLAPAALTELLASPALAGLEFTNRDALEDWFTDRDTNEVRRAAWHARESVDRLRGRGLARLMSSDAHSVDQVGRDRDSRTLTRLRVDDVNFDAVRNAILNGPKARCKAEVTLPAGYSRIVSADFKGGFIDGVSMEFSPNLNCIIGGRGSGKSTALLAIRAALGAHVGKDEDPDEADRMPDQTIVRVVDTAGSERIVVRVRGEAPREQGTDSPVRFRLADLGQDESGHLARGYDSDPGPLAEFLDRFVVRYEFSENEEDLLAQLAESAGEIKRTSVHEGQLQKLCEERDRLEGSLKAAEKGQVELIADWARLLAAQGPMVERLEGDLQALQSVSGPDLTVDVDAIAVEYGVDLEKKPAVEFVSGSGGLRETLEALRLEREKVQGDARKAMEQATKPTVALVAAWRQRLGELEARRQKKQDELEAQGLKVQAGAISDYAKRLGVVKKKIADFKRQREAHRKARHSRGKLVAALHDNRESLFQLRRATMKRICDSANRNTNDLDIRVYYVQGGMRDVWEEWLSSNFPLRRPRLLRAAAVISPLEFAEKLASAPGDLLEVLDEDGSAFFIRDALEKLDAFAHPPPWDLIFELETMRLDDQPRIEVQEPGRSQRRQFGGLSAGQQRSVLLSLLLCAERNEPLVVDQPEDHLDALYIAGAVVGHLEAAKEQRQVVIATHSPNLTVLGDAELVVPMKADDGNGHAFDVGAVDRPVTREAVCSLLEGGMDAYRKRGERYGLAFKD